MVGAPGAGKSTVVKKISELHPEMRVFSLDDVRISLFKEKMTLFAEELSVFSDDKMLYEHAFMYANANPKEFDARVNNVWVSALKSDVVVVDNTNLTRKARSRWVKDARAKGFEIIAINVVTPLTLILERQVSRADKSVPANVVRRMHFSIQEVQTDEADEIVTVRGF